MTKDRGDQQIDEEFPLEFSDARSADEQTIKDFLQRERPIRFDWDNRWLKGDEYAHILNRMD
jgi:hypothetical protein